MGKIPTGMKSLAERYPSLDRWLREEGWVQIGSDECGESFVRALYMGGMAWEGKRKYASLEDALKDLDKGIAEWVEEAMWGW